MGDASSEVTGPISRAGPRPAPALAVPRRLCLRGGRRQPHRTLAVSRGSGRLPERKRSSHRCSHAVWGMRRNSVIYSPPGRLSPTLRLLFSKRGMRKLLTGILENVFSKEQLEMYNRVPVTALIQSGCHLGLHFFFSYSYTGPTFSALLAESKSFYDLKNQIFHLRD